jgi:hypothetical protein
LGTNGAGDPELRDEGAESGLHGRCACPVKGVGLERLPLLTQLLHQCVEIKRTQPHQAVVAVLVRRCHKASQGELEPRCWPERRQPEPVDEHQMGQLVAVAAGEPRGNSATHHPPDQHRRRGAGLPDQLTQPAQHVLGVERSISRLGGTVAGQVGSDHPIGLHQVRNHPHPVRSEFSRTMQQDD